MRRRQVRSRVQALLVMVLLGLVVVGCAPDNIEFRRLDDVPYHPANAADLVVDDWDDLQALTLQEPAVADRVVDVHRSDPAPPAGAPVIIRVPGGGWVGHNQNTLPEALERYVNQGWVVVTVGYTRADAGIVAKQWPVQGHEIDWVVRWVKANAAALGVSPDKVVLLGDSAGAHLSAHVGTGVFDEGDNPALPAPAGGDLALSSFSSKPNALVLLSGAFDVSVAGVLQNPGFPEQEIDPFWPQQALLGCDPSVATCAPRVAEASVVHAGVNDGDLGNFPPTFMAHAENDGVAPFGPNTFQLALQICNLDYPDPPPGSGTHRVVTWVERLEGSDDHQLAALDYAKVDYFLFRQGLLPSVPSALPDWVCNQP